jgi:hypothetical protein
MKLAKPTLKRYELSKEETANIFPMVAEEIKGEITMKFGSQFARVSRKDGAQGVTLRSATYELVKIAVEHINSLTEVERTEVLNSFIKATPILLHSVQKTHIKAEKVWVSDIFLKFQQELKALARAQGYIQRSKTDKPSTSIFSKEDVFVHLLKYGLSLFK